MAEQPADRDDDGRIVAHHGTSPRSPDIVERYEA